MKAKKEEKFNSLYNKFLNISRGNDIIAYNVAMLLSDHPISIRRELAREDSITKKDGSSITPIHITFEYMNGKIIQFYQTNFDSKIRFANTAGVKYSCSTEQFITLEDFKIFEGRYPPRILARRNLEETIYLFNEFNESFKI